MNEVDNPQLDLFAAQELLESTPTTAQEQRGPTVTETGIAVSIEDYYLGLQGMLRYGKSINKGLDYMTKTEDQSSRSYWAINQKSSAKQIEDARGKSEYGKTRLTGLSKKIYAEKVFALDPMVENELVSKDEAKRIARKEYGDFINRYYGLNRRSELAKKTKDVESKLDFFRMQQAPKKVN